MEDGQEESSKKSSFLQTMCKRVNMLRKNAYLEKQEKLWNIVAAGRGKLSGVDMKMDGAKSRTRRQENQLEAKNMKKKNKKRLETGVKVQLPEREQSWTYSQRHKDGLSESLELHLTENLQEALPPVWLSWTFSIWMSKESRNSRARHTFQISYS